MAHVPPVRFRRTLAAHLRRAARQFPAVVLTGPRQAGKTTLLRHVAGRSTRFVSLEAPDVRAEAAADPRGFLDRHPPPVILDEIQHAPVLLPYIKERIDERRSRPGQFLLTGSQNLLLLQNVTESLAGRAAILRLLPLTRREIRGRPAAPLPWEGNAPGRRRSTAPSPGALLLRGGYPELWARPDLDPDLWFTSYNQTYLERDVRMVRQVADLSQFQTFLRALAARSGGLLDLSGLSRDTGISVNTVKAWIGVLEATHQAILVRPYHASIAKRLVKTPRLYFTDTGILCHLLGIEDASRAMKGPEAGFLFETAVISEVYKSLLHRGREPRLYFWRTSTGVEVDLLVETPGGIVSIECKSAGTPRPAMADGLLSLKRDLGDRVARGFVVHGGQDRGELAPGVEAIPLADL